MITREEFLNKIQQFTEEEQTKCLKYYDESTSKNKEEIIDGDTKKLLSTVCRWYGIVTSTKERKPRTLKQSQAVSSEFEMAHINDNYHKAFSKVVTLVQGETSLEELTALKEVITALNKVVDNRVYELQNPTKQEEDEIKDLINQLNKKIKKQGREFQLVEVK